MRSQVDCAMTQGETSNKLMSSRPYRLGILLVGALTVTACLLWRLPEALAAAEAAVAVPAAYDPGALREHAANLDVHALTLDHPHRGDAIETGETIAVFSPHTHAKSIDASGAAIYSYSGWFDGAYQHSAIKRYVTEGQLRAIHRKLSDEDPPYAQLVPYRTFSRADAAPLVAGEPAELTFDLLPTSYLFQAGHRIRVAVACADRDTVPSRHPRLLTFPL
jgi:predicted acyl esterase